MDSLIKKSKETVAFNDLGNEHARRILSDFWQSASHAESLDHLILIPLTLGRSGAGLYKFKVGEHSYILRLFSPLDNTDDRKRESYVTRIAGEYNVAPKVYYVDPEFEGIVIEFLPWRTIWQSDVQTPEGIAAFTKFLRQVYTISIEGYPAKSHFERAEEWLSTAREKGATFPVQFDEVYQTMGTIKGVLDTIPVESVLIHNDLIPLNIMTDGSSFKLVDWPAAGMGDAFWDFIDFTVFLNFDDAKAKTFMAAYFGRDVTTEEWNRFVIMRPVPSIVRAAGGFAFSEEVRPAQFYEDKCNSSELTSLAKMMEDFALGQLGLPLWEITCIMLVDSQRQINDPEFIQALESLRR